MYVKKKPSKGRIQIKVRTALPVLWQCTTKFVATFSMLKLPCLSRLFSPPANKKVMFFVVCVCHSICSQSGPTIHGPISPPPLPFTLQGSPNLVKLIQLGCHCIIEPPPSPRHVQTCSFYTTYGRQAGGWHPTGMLSCGQCE